MDYELRWSKKSVLDLEDILSYLSDNWPEIVVNNFKQILSHQLDLIIQNPLMFPYQFSIQNMVNWRLMTHIDYSTYTTKRVV